MPQKTIELNMDEIRFTSDENTVLITHGITTCIAFIVQGSFWDDDDDEIEYCGLYHWSGFDSSSTPHTQQAENALTYFLEKLRSFAGLDASSNITIDVLAFIGGEKEQRDESGAIVVSGTEAEVLSLRNAVAKFDYTAMHFTLSADDISHQHFLTTNEQSVSIELSIDECTLHVEESEAIELQENMEEYSTAMLIV